MFGERLQKLPVVARGPAPACPGSDRPQERRGGIRDDPVRFEHFAGPETRTARAGPVAAVEREEPRCEFGERVPAVEAGVAFAELPELPSGAEIHDDVTRAQTQRRLHRIADPPTRR